ncbi:MULTISPECIES: hypothetical protein [Bacillus subtilis group]|uniref:hypothetical protein n=1 Tax=Bacillus subtilis group TaxID=653685 RepID=UPI000F536EAA|nr:MULTISPECIES: hypothetical protein [Bacillus subtilis group]MDZ5669136.1 hypothetical protein [Bacillus stercoris]WIT27479.1 hypothetical protein [Bacillus phage SPbetaL4]WIT27857.1 hypothetical protein [Bacillus phage SPbetaL6]WIT28042.1 hypothetical protein [Bacillus phage SPbetaL7]
MKISGNINTSLYKKTEKCIELLPSSILNTCSDFKIVFYTREELEGILKNDATNKEDYEYILTEGNEPGGSVDKEAKEIRIYLTYDNIENNPMDTVNFIGNLYHEIRHAWQVNKNKYQDDIIIKPYEDLFGYLKQPCEVDAYNFQLIHMRKQINNILKIFNYNLHAPAYNLKDHIMEAIGREKV